MVCTVASAGLHLLGFLAITNPGQTANNVKKIRFAQAETRLYLLHDAKLENQPEKLPPSVPPAQLSSEKTGIKASASTLQTKKLKPSEAKSETLASDIDLKFTWADPAAPRHPEGLKRYFNTSEVDQVALPIDDWNFFLNHLNPGLTYTLQLEIYLNSDGGVDDWIVIKQEPEGDWVEQVVEKLKSTVLIPATKDGLPVNMVRAIEIFIKP